MYYYVFKGNMLDNLYTFIFIREYSKFDRQHSIIRICNICVFIIVTVAVKS